MSRMRRACVNWSECENVRRRVSSGGLPVPGKQGLELAAPSCDRQTLEDVLQIGERLHAIELGGREEGIHHRGTPTTGLRATEQPIAASDRDPADCVLHRGMPRPELCRVGTYGD
jgi:hypothetical protein